MDAKEQIEKLATGIARAMVDHPENIRCGVDLFRGAMSVHLQGHANDTRRLIGKFAKNHKALAMVLRMAGERIGWRVKLGQIEEPVAGEVVIGSKFKHGQINQDEIKRLFKECVRKCVEKPDEVFFETHNSGGVLTCEAVLDREEQEMIPTILGDALNCLFDTIGKSKGTLINVSVVKDSDPAQPQTSAGRYA